MSDISLSSQQQLTQALAKLSQASSTSPLIKQGAEVIIKHLAGNQLSLTNVKQDRQISLPKEGLFGQLASGQQYSAKLTTENKQLVLAFFEKNAASLTSKLSNTQLDSILKLVSQSVGTSSESRQLMVTARITQISGNKITLNALPYADKLTVNLKSPSDSAGFKLGQSVQVELNSNKGNWQATIINLTKSALGEEGKINSNLSKPITQFAPTKSADNPLIKTAIGQLLSNNGNGITIAKNELLPLVQRQPNIFPSSFINDIKAIAANNLQIVKSKDGNISIKPVSPRPVATLPISKELAQQLETLKLAIKDPILNSETANRSNTNTIANNIAASLGQQVLNTANSQKEINIDKIVTLLRQIHSVASTPEGPMRSIELALKENISNPETKAALGQLLKTVSEGIPQGKTTDPHQIKQIVTAPTFPITPNQLTSATQSQGLVGALVALVQVALLSKMARNQGAVSDRIGQIVASLTQSTNPSSATQNRRVMQDLNQLEQKHQLLKEIGKVLGNHQSNKLANAENRLQGQDVFYYTLPSTLGDARKDIELLIKREFEQQNKPNAKKQKVACWNLTMKLSIGDIGEMLTKARLKENNLELNFYTSNTATKDLVLNYLPLLKKQFTKLGIEVAKSGCQLGKIPANLQSRPYHIFETKA